MLSQILIEKYPDIEDTNYVQNISWIFIQTKNKPSTMIRLIKWDKKVRKVQLAVLFALIGLTSLFDMGRGGPVAIAILCVDTVKKRYLIK